MDKSAGESYDGGLQGMSTGISCLDDVLQGLKPGEMIVIASRPSMGKTSLSIIITEHCVFGDDGKRHPVAYFSLEMPAKLFMRRMCASRARVDIWHGDESQLSKDEKKRFAQAAEELKNAPLYVDDAGDPEITGICSRAHRLKERHGIELIVIDYLQLCSDSGQTGGRLQEMTTISRRIKELAKELKVPVILLSQPSRPNGERGKTPHISDLRDSGAIAHDSDVVCLLWRPLRHGADAKAKNASLAFANIVKNGNGRVGEVALNFDREHMRFTGRQEL